jgi:hypothetical protein
VQPLVEQDVPDRTAVELGDEVHELFLFPRVAPFLDELLVRGRAQLREAR